MGMLVLTRKVDESIVIGGNVVVTVLQIANNKVRIGISAPSAITVDRQEVHDDKEKKAQQLASNNQPAAPDAQQPDQ